MPKTLTICAVDDEIQITELLRTFLETMVPESSIHTFNDPQCALEYLQGHAVDVLITDYKMPHINGLQLLERSGPGVKKILISGYLSEVARNKFKELHATMFEKPINMQALREAILSN